LEKNVANLNRQNQEYRENEISLKNKLEIAENQSTNNAQSLPSHEENDIFSILKSRVKLGHLTQERDNKILFI